MKRNLLIVALVYLVNACGTMYAQSAQWRIGDSGVEIRHGDDPANPPLPNDSLFCKQSTDICLFLKKENGGIYPRPAWSADGISCIGRINNGKMLYVCYSYDKKTNSYSYSNYPSPAVDSEISIGWGAEWAALPNTTSETAFDIVKLAYNYRNSPLTLWVGDFGFNTPLVTGIYTSGNDNAITADACYTLHANQRFLNSTSSLLNKILDVGASNAADKAKCIGTSGKLTGLNAFPYSCMNIAMQHCDSWSSDNDRAKACGRELLRNNCLNQDAITVYNANGMTTATGIYTSGNDKEITADACYTLHANQRFLNSTSSLLNKVLDPSTSDAADKTKCIGTSGKLTGPNAFPYSCMNIAMQHCDSWSSDNDRAKACGRELLRNNCLNQDAITVYNANGMTTATGIYTSGNDKEITADACYTLHANRRFLNNTPDLLNKVLDAGQSKIADKTKCIGTSGKLTGPSAFPYSCMNIAMQHCDSWSSDNDRAKACGRELLRNNCLNQVAVEEYKSSGMTTEPSVLSALQENNSYVLKVDGQVVGGGSKGMGCRIDNNSIYTCIAVNDNDCWISDPIDPKNYSQSPRWGLTSECDGYYGIKSKIDTVITSFNSNIKVLAPSYTEKFTKSNYCTNGCVGTIVHSLNNEMMPLDKAISQGRIKPPLTFKQAVEQALVEKCGFICYDQRCYLYKGGEYEGLVGSSCQSSANIGGDNEYQCFGSVDIYSYR